MIPAQRISADKVKEYFFAGKAFVTLKNSTTQNRFTFKIKAPKVQNVDKPIFFVHVLTGSDNEGSYSFMGTIFDKTNFVHSKKSVLSQDAVSVKVIRGFLAFLHVDKVPKDVEVWHEGKCGRCGRKLTVPESIYTGIGPDCASIMQKEHLDMLSLANGQGLSLASLKAA